MALAPAPNLQPLFEVICCMNLNGSENLYDACFSYIFRQMPVMTTTLLSAVRGSPPIASMEHCLNPPPIIPPH